MDAEESDEDEDEIQHPQQETEPFREHAAISLGSIRRFTGISSLNQRQYEKEHSRDLYRARSYPARELGNHEQLQIQTSGDFQSIDRYSLQEDAVSIPVSVPPNDAANDRYATESSPKGSPRTKWEECVPSGSRNSSSSARRDRVYTANDIKDLDRYESRLVTFKIFNWDHPFMNKFVLASAGFFYKGEADEVVCVGCGNSLRGWCEGDNPWDEHWDKFQSVCFRRGQ